MARPSDTISGLAQHLEHTAEWRREKALGYPNDGRNPGAAQLCQQLCEQCLDTRPPSQGKHVTALVKYLEELHEDDTRLFSEYVESIGLHHFPDKSEELCRDLLRVLGAADQQEEVA